MDSTLYYTFRSALVERSLLVLFHNSMLAPQGGSLYGLLLSDAPWEYVEYWWCGVGGTGRRRFALSFKVAHRVVGDSRVWRPATGVTALSRSRGLGSMFARQTGTSFMLCWLQT